MGVHGTACNNNIFHPLHYYQSLGFSHHYVWEEKRSPKSASAKSFQPNSVRVLPSAFRTAFLSYRLLIQDGRSAGVEQSLFAYLSFALFCLPLESQGWCICSTAFHLLLNLLEVSTHCVSVWSVTEVFLPPALEVSTHCVSVRSVTEVFLPPVFFLTGHHLERSAFSPDPCRYCWICLWFTSVFLPQFHHRSLVSLSSLSFLANSVRLVWWQLSV